MARSSSAPSTATCAAAALLAAVTCAAVPAPAAAPTDPLVISAPGARNLTAGAGWRAWAAPTPDRRWQLVTRAPDKTVAAASIADFANPPDPSIGATSFDSVKKRFVAVYSRCRGSSATDGCDVYEYDLAAGTERNLTRISTAAGSETAPSIASGIMAFARRGGPRPGTYTANGGRVSRVDSRVAREIAVASNRVAYMVGDSIVLSRLPGDRRRTIVRRRPAFGVVVTQYRVGWLERAGDRTLAFMTDRIRPDDLTIGRGAHDLPASTQSVATDARRIVEYLDATGIRRARPALFG